MIIIFSCLTTVLVFVMIIITLVKRSSEYSKGSGRQTHVAFNKNLDKDIDQEPDILHNTKGALMGSPPDPSMHKVYSLDQLNQVSFEGFTSLHQNLVTGKYNTLPARQIAIIEQIYNQEQAPLIPTPKSILVKKVTFEKPASSSSSATSTPTLDLNSFNEGSSVGHYMDMGNRAATGVPNCIVGTSFMLGTCVGELPRLEELLADDEVLQVWEFKALVLAMSLFYLTMVS